MQDKREDVKSLFEAALARPPEAWSSFLAECCPEPAVRNEVERLLACHREDPDFMSASSRNKGSDSARDSSLLSKLSAPLQT